MFGGERLSSDNTLSDIPLGPLPQLHAELIVPLVQISLDPAGGRRGGAGSGGGVSAGEGSGEGAGGGGAGGGGGQSDLQRVGRGRSGGGSSR